MKTVIKKIQNWTDLVSALADRMLLSGCTDVCDRCYGGRKARAQRV